MCGIAGAIDFAGKPIDPRKVLQMAEVQSHRGPDGEGAVFFFNNDNWLQADSFDTPNFVSRAQGAVGGLVHRRLAIIDLSERASQPMADDRGECWITFNGEIYNYLELRAELQERGHTFRSQSDTEVILYAYREWGLECLERFNGMFAFALWDARQRRLFCARDRLGIKPFYYLYHQRRFFFASEPKGILAALEQRPAPNVSAMADYLCFSYVPSLETMFQGIRRLQPGNWLVADATGLQLHSYWAPVFDPAKGHSEQDWVEELRALLEDSIRLQIRSDVPIGAHLSGGIDSSIVCCLAAQHVPRLLTFTARFPEGGAFDESLYARVVAQQIAAKHCEMVPDVKLLTDLLPRMLYYLDEPVEGPAIFGKYHVAECVSQSVKVVLTGHGGDELFGGYDWYIKNLFTAACFGAHDTLEAHARVKFLWQTLMRENPKRLVKSLWTNCGDTNLSQIFCRNWNRLSQPRLEKIFRPGLVDEPSTSEQRFLAAYEELQEQRAGDRMFKFDMRYYLEALLTSEDRLSMAFSVESRVPLLDHRIAELAGHLGFELKTQPGRSKRILRLATEGIVPPEILRRRDKRGFPTPLDTWLRDPKLNLMEALLLNGNSFADRYFDLNHIRKMLTSRTFMSSDWSERLWRVLNLGVWGQVFNLT